VTAISAAAETLLDGGMQLDEQARSFVQVIARHAERLKRLTDDLLDLSRLETGVWKPTLGPVQLAPLGAAVIELYRASADEKQITLGSDVPENLRARADRRALEQILVNLLDNAIKFTPPRGRVTLLGDGLGPAVMLSVVDTGPGIEPQHQPRIFERFYRADAGRSRDQGGTGLGLAIVKHLTQSQGGEVGVESNKGGSRFWVKLPTG
jgi:two-component system phosphate regulon sensor histidine kinase PhoR